MEETSPERPTPIHEAADRFDNDSLMTVAAFMLLAGTGTARLQDDQPLVEDGELEELGLLDWSRAGIPEKRLGSFDMPVDDSEISRDDYYRVLAKSIYSALESGSASATVAAVNLGLRSPDDLVRICALISAVDLYSIHPLQILSRLMWFLSREINPTTATLTALLLNRVMGFSQMAGPPDQASGESKTTTKPGLMLIHGTNFPPGRPEWSVPRLGPLFNHIQGFRPDVYGKPDYYRWEGGYSDYAREVAALNLRDWLQSRLINEIDAVTHSHGGNVLMESTRHGTKFDKVLFLSCPVRWVQYFPRQGTIKKPMSVRIKFDFVILGDRASQRFPPTSGIQENILPIWFTKHSSSYQVNTWKKQNLDRLIR